MYSMNSNVLQYYLVIGEVAVRTDAPVVEFKKFLSQKYNLLGIPVDHRYLRIREKVGDKLTRVSHNK